MVMQYLSVMIQCDIILNPVMMTQYDTNKGGHKSITMSHPTKGESIMMSHHTKKVFPQMC